MGQGGAVSNAGGAKNKKQRPSPIPSFIFNLVTGRTRANVQYSYLMHLWLKMKTCNMKVIEHEHTILTM